jgi:regulating synaptic membrane exocytosis protein 1
MFLGVLFKFYQLFSAHHRKKAPGLSEQNGKGGQKSERKRVPKSVVQPGEGTADERERKERRETRRLEKGRSQDYPDRLEKREDGRVAEDEKQRKEEEYQTRYRSDPNLARYPVKAPLEEQQMRMHARVSRARHERRHSDVALPHTEAAAAVSAETTAGKRAQTTARVSPPESPRARAPAAQPPAEHGPPPPRPAPGPAEPPEPRVPEPLRKQGRLDPGSAVLLRKAKREKAESMLRNDSLSSDQSESVRPSPPKPHRPKRGGKRRQMSVSSSEEEGVSTPEYTSCEDVELESESVSEKGERGSEVEMRAQCLPAGRCWAGGPLCQAHLRGSDVPGRLQQRCCAPRSLRTRRTGASIPLQACL